MCAAAICYADIAVCYAVRVLILQGVTVCCMSTVASLSQYFTSLHHIETLQVQLWRGREMETLACFDAKTVGAGLLTGTVPVMHSVSWNAANSKLLIGVDSGDLYEMSGTC
jgi:hypothetical protein